MTVFVLSCGDLFAIRKRGETGLLSGMWELYHVSGHLKKAEAASHLSEAGFEVESISSCGSATHIFTHLEWNMKGYRVKVKEPFPGLTWKTREEIESEYAIPGAFRYFKGKM